MGLTANLVTLLHFVFFLDEIIVIIHLHRRNPTPAQGPVKLHGYYRHVKLHLCITVTHPMRQV